MSTPPSSKWKTFCLLALLQLLCAPLDLFAQEVAVVQSMGVRPYNEALSGFRSVCGAEVRRFVIAQTPPLETLRYLRKNKPRIILAIGRDALDLARKVGDVPIVYVMVGTQQLPAQEGNVTGVTMTIAPEKQLSLLQKALPWVRRIGVLYDPGKNALFMRKAHLYARSNEIEMIGREVRSPKEVHDHLESLKGSIDLFWMLPDTTVVTPETVEYFLLFSLRNRVPILTFSEKYVEQGALLSFDIDPSDLGRQAGEMVCRVLAGNPVTAISPAGPRTVLFTVNSKVARKLGVTISHEVLEKARVY